MKKLGNHLIFVILKPQILSQLFCFQISPSPPQSRVPFYMLSIYLLPHSSSIKSITNPHSALISEIYLTKSINNYFEHLFISVRKTLKVKTN